MKKEDLILLKVVELSNEEWLWYKYKELSNDKEILNIYNYINNLNINTPNKIYYFEKLLQLLKEIKYI